jgi:hypothetical protein
MQITPSNQHDRFEFEEAWAALPPNVQRMLDHLRRAFVQAARPL